jgi:hypothetical protein
LSGFKHPGWPSFFAVLGGTAVALLILFAVASNFPR